MRKINELMFFEHKKNRDLCALILGCKIHMKNYKAFIGLPR